MGCLREGRGPQQLRQSQEGCWLEVPADCIPTAGQVLYFGHFGQLSSLSTTVLSFCLSHHLCSYTLWEHFLQIPLNLPSWRKRTEESHWVNNLFSRLCGESWDRSKQKGSFLSIFSAIQGSAPAHSLVQRSLKRWHFCVKMGDYKTL